MQLQDLSGNPDFKFLSKIDFSDPLPVLGIVTIALFDDFDVIEYPKET